MKNQYRSLRVVALLVCSGGLGMAGPLNDNFADHIPLIGVRLAITATNNEATREPGEPGEGNFYRSPLLRTVWWSWTAPADGVLGVSVIGSDFQAVLDVHKGTALEKLDSVSDCPMGQWCATSRVTVATGTTYYIVVGSENNSAGNIMLNLAFIGQPPNDKFADRIQLGSDNVSVIANNAAATTEPGEPQPKYSLAGRTMWWSWVAPTNGPVTVGVEAGHPSAESQLFATEQKTITGFSVFVGDSLSTLALVTNRAEQIWGIGTPWSQATFEAIAGTTYQIAVDGDVGLFDSLRLYVARTRPPLVILTSPVNNTEFHVGDFVLAVAEGFDQDGLLNAVEFSAFEQYGRDHRTATVRARPFRFEWSDLVPGRYELTARATDNLGAKADAIPVSFNVRPVNDDFARRLSFAGSFVTVTGALANASSEPDDPFGNTVANVWWAWTAPTSGTFTVTAISAMGYYPTLAVFTGNSLSQLKLLARSPFANFDTTYSTRVVIAAQAGTAYAIAVAGGGYDDWCRLSIAQTVPPVVTITSPTNESSFVQGDVVTFQAHAQDPDGTVRRVEFLLNDSVLLGAVTNSPFSLTLVFTNGSAHHRVRAKAVDNAGLVSASDVVWFDVRNPGPPNDNFADRVNFTGSFVTVTGTTADATSEPGETSFVPPGSAWWAWTALESGDFTITASSQPGYWPSLAVFTGSTLATLNLITNNAYLGRDPSYSVRVVFPAQVGTTYPIAVASRGDISLTVTKSLPPSVSITSPTNGASFNVGEIINLVAEASDPDGSVSQVEYFLYGSVLLGAVTNHPFLLPCPTTNLNGYIRLQAAATDDKGITTYSDEIQFLVQLPGPPNDHFADRVNFTGSFVTVTGTTANATFEPGETSPVSRGSAWWAWTAPESGDFTITVASEPAYWPSMAVFTGSTLATLNLITNGAFQGDNRTYSTYVVMHAEAGTIYPIAVAGGGRITLAVTKALPPSVEIISPTNDSLVLVGETFNLVAQATNSDGTVRRVAFYHSGSVQPLGVVTNGPFVLSLNSINLYEGDNWIQALATDDHGLISASAKIRLIVRYPAPPNDNFANRIFVSGTMLLIQGQMRSATLESGETTIAPDPITGAGGSVWWSWIAPASGKVLLASSPRANFLGVYTGSTVSNLITIATKVANGSELQLTFDALAGVEYQIVLASPNELHNPGQWSLFQDAHELRGPTLLPGGVFKFQLVTPPGRTWVIEAGTNLVQWTSVATGYCADGVLDFLDPNAPLYPHRFYRAVAAP